MVSTLTLLALASGAIALQVTSPSKSSVWTVGDSETITWDTVSSDQDSFNIYLSNMASYPSTTILLASDVSSSDGSATIDGSKLTPGVAFTINFTNGTETEQIYAQSSQFNITESTTSSSSSAASSASSTASSTGKSSSSATATGTASDSTASATGSSTGTSTGASASSTSATSTSGAGKIVAGWMGLAAVAALAL